MTKIDMSKIKGKTCIWENEKRKEEKIEGILFPNKILYKEKDIMVKVVWDEKEIMMTRKHKDYEIKLLFQKQKKKKGNYLLKKENIYLDIYTVSEIVKKDKNKIEVKYTLYIEAEKVGNYIWNLEYEVIK